MKGFGRHDIRTAPRNAPRPPRCAPMTFARTDGKAPHLRKTADPDCFRAETCRTMQIPPPSPNVRRTVA